MVDKSRNDDDKLPELSTLKEAADILKVHPNTLRAWDKKGILVAIRLGERKVRRYKKEKIIEFINQKSK